MILEKGWGLERAPEIQRAIDLMKQVDSLTLDDSRENADAEFQNFISFSKNGIFYYPDFKFPNLDVSIIKEIMKEIKRESEGSKNSNNFLYYFYSRLLVRLEQLTLISQTKSGINTPDEVQKYQKIDSILNTKPNKDLFLLLLTRIQDDLSKDINSQDEELKKRALALNAVIPTAGRKISYTPPKNLKLSGIDESILIALSGMLIEDKKNYTAEEIKKFFEQALKNLKIIGWNIDITQSSKTALSVRSSEQKILIPSTREIIGEELRKKIAHELCVHVVRAKNGFESDLPLLGVGIGDYLPMEEGIAKLYEEHLGGNKNLPGEKSILALGLVQGHDGIPRDFKQLFEIYLAYHSWESYKTGKKIGPKILIKNSWNRCVRVFKGIHTKTKGVCSSKDFAYQQGYIDLIDFLRDLDDIEKGTVLEYLMQGKFSLFNENVQSVLKDIPKSVLALFID